MNSLCVGENYTWVGFGIYTVASHVIVALIHLPSLLPLFVGDFMLFCFLYKFRSIPITSALEAYMLGSAPAVIFAIGAEFITSLSVLSGLSIGTSTDLKTAIVSAFMYAFVMAAMIEEICKFAIMKIGYNRFATQNFQLDQFKSIVLFSGIGALGFSTMENAKYVMGGFQTSFVLLTFIRVIFATTLHVGTGIYIGLSGAKTALSHSRARYLSAEDRASWEENWVHALLVPILVHGMYDFLSFLTSALTNHELQTSKTVSFASVIPVLIVLFVISPAFYKFIVLKYRKVTAAAQQLFEVAPLESNEDAHLPLVPASPEQINLL